MESRGGHLCPGISGLWSTDWTVGQGAPGPGPGSSVTGQLLGKACSPSPPRGDRYIYMYIYIQNILYI